MQMSNAEYQRYVDRLAPKSKLWKNMFNAFWTGGLICTLGQVLMNAFRAAGLDKQMAGTAVSICLVFLSAVLTGFAVYDDIAKLAGWDGIRLTSLHCPEDHPYQGKSIAEIAAMWGQNPLDCCCDLLVREHGEITMVDFMASEEDIVTILQNPLSNVISDATYPTDGMPHPRVYGTFVHLLEHFVKERGALTASQAVHKMTQKPARVLHLDGKGVLAAGMDADINVFDLEKLHQPGTYENPRCLAVGMDYVLVDGAVAVEKGRCTGVKAGRILRR